MVGGRAHNDAARQIGSVRSTSAGRPLAAHSVQRNRTMATAPVTPKPASPPTSRPSDLSPPRDLKPLYFLAWLLCAIFYFFQYAVRSSPGVMQQELTTAWGGNHIGAMISAYYVAYAVMALVAGVLLDRYGPRNTIPYGIAVVGIGCLIFA